MENWDGAFTPSKPGAISAVVRLIPCGASRAYQHIITAPLLPMNSSTCCVNEAIGGHHVLGKAREV